MRLAEHWPQSEPSDHDRRRGNHALESTFGVNRSQSFSQDMQSNIEDTPEEPRQTLYLCAREGGREVEPAGKREVRIKSRQRSGSI
jgi:hypothetical protein